MATLKNSASTGATPAGATQAEPDYGFLDLKQRTTKDRRAAIAYVLLMLMTVWLLLVAHSATPLACTVIGGCIMLALRNPGIRHRVKTVGLHWFVLVPLCLLALDSIFGLGEIFVGTMGRDLTFTGRTDIWQRCLRIDINPLLGCGYSGFWAGVRAERVSEGFYYTLKEAHSGYLETYLNSGLIGVFLLTAVLISGVRRMKAGLASGSSYAALRLAYLVLVASYNFTESAFCGLVLMWFILLLGLVDYPGSRRGLVRRWLKSCGSVLPFFPLTFLGAEGRR